MLLPPTELTAASAAGDASVHSSASPRVSLITPMQPGVSLLVWMKTGRMVHVNKKPESKLLRGALTVDVTGSNQ